MGRSRRSTRGCLRGTPFDEVPAPPNQLRWDPLPIPSEATDFVDGLITIGGNGDPIDARRRRRFTSTPRIASMEDRFFYNADGELLIVPAAGRAA